ncbi:MAG: GPW/gp25 family protein [Bacteroidota bacterium]
MMYLKFSYEIDATGRSATTARSEHIKDLIEQVIFTAPGERVNRPTFGSGLQQLVFEPNSPELAATVQYLVKGALQQWLSEVIEIGEVSITAMDSALRVQISYRELQNPMVQSVTFDRPI